MTEEMSIEDSLRDAMNEVSSEGESEGESTQSSEVKTEPTPAVEPKTEPKVTKSESAPAKREAQPEKESTTEAPSDVAEAPEESGAEVEDSDYEVPKFLDAEERASFNKLPKEAKLLADRFVRRRDLNNQRWVTKVRQEAQEHIRQSVEPYAQLEQVLTPHVQRLGLSGKDLASTINSTLLWDKLIDENPVEALAQLCNQKRVTPRQLFDYIQGNGESHGDAVSSGGSQPSGGETELRSLVTSLQAKIQTLEEGGVKSKWAGVVSQLAASRDPATGTPLYPYYEDIRPEMAEWTVILGGQHPEYNPAQLFKAAYEKATWANENVRALLLQDRMGQQAASSIARKRAAGSLPASSNGLASKPRQTPQSESASIEQSILEAANSLGVEF